MDADPSGRVFLAVGNLIYRHDPRTNQTNMVAKTAMRAKVSFNPTFDTLYAMVDPNVLMKMTVDLAGNVGQPTQVATLQASMTVTQTGNIAVDECGNIYQPVYTATQGKAMLRMSSDGKTQTAITNSVADPHDIAFGRGNGWPETRIYYSNPALAATSYYLDVGVRGKKY